MDRFTELLDVLRGRERVTYAELASRLGVTERTVRRDLATAPDRDVELDVRAGPRGGVRLVRDGSLPALRFTDDEALVLALALGAAAGDSRLEAPARSARRRLTRVLTSKYGEQLVALAGATRRADLLGDDPVQAPVLFALCLAAARGRRVELSHTSPAGRRTRRALDPYAVVPMAGHWYVTGFCVLRRAVRTFRVDRVSRVVETDVAVATPDDFDAEEVVATAIRGSGDARFRCGFVLACDAQTARRLLPAYRVELADVVGGVRGTIQADERHLPQIALMLVELEIRHGIAVTGITPPELRHSLAGVATRAGQLAEGTQVSSSPG